MRVGAAPPAAGTVNLLTAFQQERRPLYHLIEVSVRLQGGGTTLRRVELLSRCAP